MRYAVVIEAAGENYSAYVPDLPGCVATGGTPSETEAAIREAIRGLTAMGFVAVRHGSGAYVTAVRDHLVANSLGALIQLEEVSIADILGILSVLNLHAAALAAEHATLSDIAALDTGLKAVEQKMRVLVFAPDGAVARKIDQLLWTWQATGFLPHCHVRAEPANIAERGGEDKKAA